MISCTFRRASVVVNACEDGSLSSFRSLSALGRFVILSSNVVCAEYVCGFCCASREVGGGANDNVPGAKENYRLPSCPMGGYCIVITGVGWLVH